MASAVRGISQDGLQRPDYLQVQGAVLQRVATHLDKPVPRVRVNAEL
jgi:hypothetical protein